MIIALWAEGVVTAKRSLAVHISSLKPYLLSLQRYTCCWRGAGWGCFPTFCRVVRDQHLHAFSNNVLTLFVWFLKAKTLCERAGKTGKVGRVKNVRKLRTGAKRS